MSGVEYLDVEDLLELVRMLNVGPVRDLGMFDASAARPRARVLGEDAYPTLALKAGALLHSLSRNHALVDGNKRLAWLATLVFLDLNGHAADVTDDVAFDLVTDVARGDPGVEEITGRLQITPTRWT